MKSFLLQWSDLGDSALPLCVCVLMMSVSVPAGLHDLLKNFTVEVLKQQPENLLEFAVLYFTELRDECEDKSSPVMESRQSDDFNENDGNHIISMEDEEEDDFPDDFTFKRM